MLTASEPRPLHIVHFIAGLQASGAEIALSRLIRQSSGHGLKHTGVSLTGRGDLATDIEDAGGTVVGLDLRLSLELLSGVVGAIDKLRGLRPDILQGWMVHGNLAAWAIRLLLYPRVRLAWNLRMSLQNAIHESSRTMALTRLAGRFSRSVDLLVSNSAAGLHDHQAVGYRPRASTVIPNGFDPDIFRPDAGERERVRRQWGMPQGAVAYGLVGRYHAVKGHDIFIRAAALARGHPDMFFILIGRDASPDNLELVSELERYGVTESFRLLGPRNDVQALLCGLDVVCMPSAYEGFPNALGEAMAAGIPCIATDVSDVRAIVNGAGRIIPIGDAHALAEAMMELQDLGPARRATLGASARCTILRNYTLEAVAVAYVARYRALIAGTPDLG
jgi:glycosyltransferase involved in cell wall biosynthesis